MWEETNLNVLQNLTDINLLKPWRVLYVLPGLIFKNSTWRSLSFECFVWISEQTATFALYIIN